MTGFIVNVFPFRNRVSSTEAFEGLELGEGKLSRPVLRARWATARPPMKNDIFGQWVSGWEFGLLSRLILICPLTRDDHGRRDDRFYRRRQDRHADLAEPHQ